MLIYGIFSGAFFDNLERKKLETIVAEKKKIYANA